MRRRGEPGADGTLDGIVDIVNVNRNVLKAEIAGTDRRTLIAVRSFCRPTNSNVGLTPKALRSSKPNPPGLDDNAALSHA